MKAEHRKELQTNALADRLGRFFKGFKTGSSSGGLAILVIVVLVAIIVLAFFYFNRTTKRARSEMWLGLDKITTEELSSKNKGFHASASDDEDLKKTIEKLERIATDNPDTKASLVARFRIAQINLVNRGINLLPQYGKAEAALKSLDRAEEDYEKLVKECKNDVTWEPQARLALAKIAETRAVKDLENLDKAQALYEQLAEQFGDTASGQEAAERVQALKDSKKRAEIKALYKYVGEMLRVDRPGR
jgi:hypothetical protein